jgi:hypothetical protein
MADILSRSYTPGETLIHLEEADVAGISELQASISLQNANLLRAPNDLYGIHEQHS